MNRQSINSRTNNFDVLRLIAAAQVFIVHGTEHLKIDDLQYFSRTLSYLPGVPIFFVISGFLISKSWETKPDYHSYFKNRVLRIYPALWVCLLFSIAIFVFAGIRPDSITEFIFWLVAQISFMQFYNPDFLRGFGVGVINGSLWTIPVELQFYILLPFVYAFCRRKIRRWVIVGLLSILLVLTSRYLIDDNGSIWQKLLKVSLVPYFFYFLVGTILRFLYEKKPIIFRGKAGYFVILYILSISIQKILGFNGLTGNNLNILQIILLGSMVVSLAFSWPRLSEVILRGNDISYGVYIYHMPVINTLIFAGIYGLMGFYTAIVLTIVMSIISWRCIESKALRLKQFSLRPVR